MKASDYKLTAKEAEEQEALFEWAARLEGKYPDLKWMYHIANGEKRDKATAAKLQRMGVKSGVLDIFLPVAVNGFHGMYVEMKRLRGGVLSQEQLDWIDHLMRQGYYVLSCKGWEDASRHIELYLSGKIRRGA